MVGLPRTLKRDRFIMLPILASSVVSLYFLELTDIFQPVHSGYSCNDRSLSLPYILPRQEVCTLPLLFSLAFAAPTATVKSLGVILNSTLSFKTHISDVIRSAYFHIRNIILCSY
ncbi:hypothetical protein NQZ68_020886 [Dissostichus eleginoides]|nr:hypothetical protein NQZ68_020886 [Dissostichus eleginoides]